MGPTIFVAAGLAKAKDNAHVHRVGKAIKGVGIAINMQESKFPSLEFDTTGIPVQDRFDAWFQLNCPHFDISAPWDPKHFNGTVKAWQVGEVVFADMSFMPGPNRIHRIRLEPMDCERLIVRYFANAGYHGNLDGSPICFDSGEVHILTFQSDLEVLYGNLVQISAYIPYNLVGYDPSRDQMHRAFGPASPINQVVKTTLLDIVARLPRASTREATELSSVFCGMIRALVSTANCDEDAITRYRLATRATIRKFVMQNLTDPNLNVEHVCRQFPASCATIYREFARDGGLMRFITNQRLWKAHGELTVAPGDRGSVAEIAERYAFSDAGSFTRAFRNKFGHAPSDLLSVDWVNKTDPLPTNQGGSHPVSDSLGKWVS